MRFKVADLPKRLGGEIPNLVVVAGPEEFLRREAVTVILEKAHGGPPAAEEVTRVTPGAKPSADDLTELFDDLKTPSLFGDSRSIVVDGADKLLAVDRDAWAALVASGFSGARLFLVLDALDGRTKVAKAIDKNGWLVQAEKPFHRPPPWKPNAKPWQHELNDWIVARADRLGLRLDPPTAHLLQTRVGSSTGDLAGALDRLATVLGRDAVARREDIIEHTPDGEESNLFELVDIFFLGDRARSLHLAREVLHRGSVDSRGQRVTDPGSLLLQFIGAGLRRARQLRETHRVLGAGGGDADLMSSAGIARPFLPRLKEQARVTSPERLRHAIAGFRRADRDMKTGRGPRPDEILERLMVEPG